MLKLKSLKPTKYKDTSPMVMIQKVDVLEPLLKNSQIEAIDSAPLNEGNLKLDQQRDQLKINFQYSRFN